MKKISTIHHRAWIEINLSNFENNIKIIQQALPSGCHLMPVIKADAYGHGSLVIAKKLNELGIFDMAVATLKEAIVLRENHVKGNILILGYTDPEDLHLMLKYDLIQTIVDGDYIQALRKQKRKKPLKVHIKINTGMNRIGIAADDIETILQVYQLPQLKPLGMYSHFAVADSPKKADQKFTQMQIDRFFACAEAIKQAGYDPGYIHLQNSYGLLAYPIQGCHFVRTGLLMYGVILQEQLLLKPVLSLKATIISVKDIKKGESVGYGRYYQAKSNRKIATVSIGYADGYPLSLSQSEVKVKVKDQFVPLAGRICMDQLMIDISGVEAEVGDVVTLIGEEEPICAATVALEAGTSTYDLLSRLGPRLEKVIIN